MGPEAQASRAVARKRRSSTNEAEIGRTVKHRSSQACQSCRKRKVRCDVVIASGSPCTNCRLDGMECVVLPSRRGKNKHTFRNSATDITQSFPPQLASMVNDSVPDVASNANTTGHEGISTSTGPDNTAHVPVCVTFDQELDNVESDQVPTNDDATRNDADRTPSQVYNGLLTPEIGMNTSRQYQSPAGKAPLTAFIAPLSSRVSSEDLDFLTQKGAMAVAEPDLQLDILRGYLFSVHPFMPMLDFRTFVHAILNNREDSQISLLLFQAVMFAGLHSLPLHVIHRLGFESAKQARGVFFNRVRLLYEFDVEQDSAAVLQSLILMSSWYSRWDERRHTWHWTGLAYDLARSMGLHREPTTRGASKKVRYFRRRLWWSLYIRDRMIALGTRRPMRIRDDDFDVAMLTLEDFDLEPSLEPNQGSPLIPDAKENTSTALMCIQLAKLCICIGHVTSSQYTTLSVQPDVPNTMMVVSRRRDKESIQELERCDRELNEWFQALTTNIRRNGSAIASDGSHSCSEVHWWVLNLTYLTAVNVLHRAQALQPQPDAADAQIAQKSSRSKVKDAARSLTKLLQTMLRQDQVRFLGLIGVTALVAACLSHMLDISSGDEDVRDASTLRLYQSLEVLHALRSIYASADAAVRFLGSIMRTAGISVPAQVAAPTSDFIAVSADDLLRPPTSGKQSTAWKDSSGFLNGKWSSPSDQIHAAKVGWQVDPLVFPQRPANSRSQPQIPLDRNTQTLATNIAVIPTASAGNVDSSELAFTTSNIEPASCHGVSNVTKDAPTTEESIPQLVDTAAGGLSNGAFFNWNNDIDPSMGLEPLTFNYDFYSDSFGSLDGPLPKVYQV